MMVDGLTTVSLIPVLVLVLYVLFNEKRMRRITEEMETLRLEQDKINIRMFIVERDKARSERKAV